MPQATYRRTFATAASIEAGLRVLGLSPVASKQQVRTAFRRLVKACHPDRHPTPEAARRFIEIVETYRVLEVELRLNDPHEPRQRCPQCSRYAELFDGLDGRAGCLACLLGETQRSRFLPLPIIVVARHFSVFGLYAASLALAVAYWQTPRQELALASLGASLAGLLVLAVTSITVRDVCAD